MQFFNNAFAAVIIAVAGDVWSPRVVSGLHISAGDGGDSRHDGLENGIRGAKLNVRSFTLMVALELPGYEGHTTRGCVNRNELGSSDKATAASCAAACTSNTQCVSFEYPKTGTKCLLSSSCDRLSRTVNDPPHDSYNWYLKDPPGYERHATGGCVYGNDLGSSYRATAALCAAACTSNTQCVSFEYPKAGTKCLLSSSCDRLSRTVNNPHDSYNWYLKDRSYPEDNDFPEDNGFKAPGPDDIRSPCPAINTIANHGFIHRNGRDIDVDELAQALEDIFRISKKALLESPIADAMKFDLTDKKEGRDVLTIDRLFQSRDSVPDGSEAVDHDSSFFREDSVASDDSGSRLPSTRLIDNFFEVNDGANLHTMDIMVSQRMRISESCKRRRKRNTSRKYTAAHRRAMGTQGAKLLILGQAQGPNFERVSSNIRTIVGSEILPENYHPNKDVLFSFGEGCNSDAVRDGFRVNVDLAICDFCPEDEDFPCPPDTSKIDIVTLSASGC